MLTMGDECGRTQKGNNNAYCQDNEVSWMDWVHADQELLLFTQSLIAFRKAHPVFSMMRHDGHGSLRDFLSSGQRKIDKWYAALRVVEVPFDDEADAFMNINTREELGSLESRRP